MDVPEEILREANEASDGLLPDKSRWRYEKVLADFKEWRKIKCKSNIINETIILAYLSTLSKILKPSSLWTKFSMLKKAIIIDDGYDISR